MVVAVTVALSVALLVALTVAVAVVVSVALVVVLTVAVSVAVTVALTVALAVTAKEKAEWSYLQAVSHFQKWIQSGKPTAENGHPKLGKIAAVTITHSLLPRCAPTEKVADYKSMKKCTEWVATAATTTTTKATRTSTTAAAIPTVLT